MKVPTRAGRWAPVPERRTVRCLGTRQAGGGKGTPGGGPPALPRQAGQEAPCLPPRRCPGPRQGPPDPRNVMVGSWGQGPLGQVRGLSGEQPQTSPGGAAPTPHSSPLSLLRAGRPPLERETSDRSPRQGPTPRCGHVSVFTPAGLALGETEAQATAGPMEAPGHGASRGGRGRGMGPTGRGSCQWQAWSQTAFCPRPPPPAHPPGMHPSLAHIPFLSALPGAETSSDLAEEPRRKPPGAGGQGPGQGHCLGPRAPADLGVAA